MKWSTPRRINFATLAVLCLLFATLSTRVESYIVTREPVVFDLKHSRPDTVEQRIKRVEQGLLPPYIIKGSPPVAMNLSERMNFYKVPGLSIAIINKSSIDWARGYGRLQVGTVKPVDANTIFQAGAISTAFAAVGALSLVQQGRLNLDQDVNQNLSSWKIPDSGLTASQKVTLRRLLNHSAGLNVRRFEGYPRGEDIPSILQILKGERPANSPPIGVGFIPGSRWRYSGGGYVVLQQLMSDVTHKGFSDEVNELVLKVLALDHSTFEQELPEKFLSLAATGHNANGEAVAGSWHLHPEMAAEGLWTNPTDLATFVIELQKSKAGQSNKILNLELTRQMFTPGLNNYGLGVALQGSGAASRFTLEGSNQGFRAFIVAYADTGQAAVIMTNSENSAELAQEIFLSIAKEYKWPDYHPEVIEIANVDPQIYQTFVGQYELFRDLTIDIIAENDHLYWKFPGREKEELLPTSETDYIFTHYNGLKVMFVRNQASVVTGLTLKQGGNVINARKL